MTTIRKVVIENSISYNKVVSELELVQLSCRSLQTCKDGQYLKELEKVGK